MTEMSTTPCETQALKPCPFCGGKAKLYKEIAFIKDDHPLKWVSCSICYCSSNSFFMDEKKAIEAWNKRPESELEKIKKICDSQPNNCVECPFGTRPNGCSLTAPTDWDLDKINKILDDSGHLVTNALSEVKE